MIQAGVAAAGEGGEAPPTLKITEVSPLALADEFGVDPLRYHLLRDVPLGGDGDFSYEGIVARYNADLANNLGNLLSRVATVVHSKCGGIGPAPDPESTLSARPPRCWRRPVPPGPAGPPTRPSRPPGASSGRPTPSWRPPSPGRWIRAPQVDAVLGNALEVLRIVAILISPAMPATAAEIWRRIGVEGDPSSARVPGDAAWGQYPGGVPVVKGDPLFPRRKG